MITLIPKVHDRFTLEFKTLYKARRKVKKNNFMLNFWIFVPNSLDINNKTYSRVDFYKDLRTNIRLITPVFLLREIVNGKAMPLKNLKNGMNEFAINPTRTNSAEYEYQIKMFAAIYKSALRDQISYIFDKTNSVTEQNTQIEQLLFHAKQILEAYRNLAHIIKTPTITKEQFSYFVYGDEFITNITLKEFYKIGNNPDKSIEENTVSKVIDFLKKEETYKLNQNHSEEPKKNTQYQRDGIFRMSMLKKYIDSDLFLNANKKKDAAVIADFYQSIAAGISMVVATVIAFFAQQIYGNFTLPLFIALVIGYMLKDRIKEHMRYYYASKHNGKYFDNKTTISIKEKIIGWTKESFDFITESKVPADVMLFRNRHALLEAENRFANEKIILFRKTVFLERQKIDENTTYDIDGVAEITRLNLSSFMRKMDNPEFPIYKLNEEKGIEKNTAIRNYYLNIVVQLNFDNKDIFQRYLIKFNRDEVVEIKLM